MYVYFLKNHHDMSNTLNGKRFGQNYHGFSRKLQFKIKKKQ